MSTYHAFGDSVTAGTLASVPAKDYASLVAAGLGLTLDNEGVSTQMVFDGYDRVLAATIASGDVSSLAWGINDEAKYGVDASKLPYYIDGLRSCAVRLGAAWKAATPANGVTFSGSWGTGFTRGIYGATAAGAKATFVATGTTVLISTLRQAGNTSTFQVKVNGVVHGPYSTNGAVATILGRSYGPYGLAFSCNVGDTIELDALTADGSNPVYFDWFSNLAPFAKVILVNVLNFIGSPPVAGGTLANIVTYNNAVSALASELAGYGLDVHYADVNSVVLPADMATDGIHPVDSGHAKEANAILAAAGIAPPSHTFVAGIPFKRDDGVWFVGVSSPEKQIVTA